MPKLTIGFAVCEVCGRESTRRICLSCCGKMSRGVKRKKYTQRKVELSCALCGSKFPGISRARYCSKACRRKRAGLNECGLCRRVGHAAADCPKRKPRRVCIECGSLPHRVKGPRCKSCKLLYAPEPAAQVGDCQRSNFQEAV